MFKKIIITIFLITLSIRPMFYVGNVVYFQTHLNEIIEEYCVNKYKPELQCNGQCHLAKEISSIDEYSNRKDVVINASLVFFPVFYQEIKKIKTPLISKDEKTSYYTYNSIYSFLKSSEVNKPPIV